MGYNSAAALAALPESSLYYPGATVLGGIGSDPYRYLGGEQSGSSGHFLGVDATREEVFAFYAAQLPARGWQRDRFLGVVDYETSGIFWRRGDLRLEIGILYNPKIATPDIRLPKGSYDYVTAYRLQIFYAPVRTPTPRR